MQATAENILEAFNQLPEIEKHALAFEIIKQVALLDIPPLSVVTVSEAKFLRKLGNLQPEQLSAVEDAVRQWLKL